MINNVANVPSFLHHKLPINIFIFVMKFNEDLYDDDTIQIHSELLDTDFDEVGFEPEEEIGDNDDEMAGLFDY